MKLMYKDLTPGFLESYLKLTKADGLPLKILWDLSDCLDTIKDVSGKYTKNRDTIIEKYGKDGKLVLENLKGKVKTDAESDIKALEEKQFNLSINKFVLPNTVVGLNAMDISRLKILILRGEDEKKNRDIS